MNITPLEMPDVKMLYPEKFGDQRGFFSETCNKRVLADHGIDIEFVQDNHSYSSPRGTIRGLHFQIPPYAQDKLVRVIRGTIFDVAVDLRADSPTLGEHVTAVVSADEWNQILVPAGFAHGFCTLEPDTEVIYKVSSYYAPQHDLGMRWNDPRLAIDWPVSEDEAVLSDKDRVQPLFEEIDFRF